jgi:hypothetical protein
MFSRKQSFKGGKASQKVKASNRNAGRRLELESLACKHAGFAEIVFSSEDTLTIKTGVNSGREFFADSMPEAIFNDGTCIGGQPDFLDKYEN